jgi:hypothetical protein
MRTNNITRMPAKTQNADAKAKTKKPNRLRNNHHLAPEAHA